MMPDFAKVEAGFRSILEGLGVNPEDPHFKETPNRAAKAFYYELCSGITTGEPKVTTFPQPDGVKSEMIISRGIPVRSVCAHHLLPFVGEAVVGYIPFDRILGLSKMTRVVNFWARRPQVQEQLTSSAADDLVQRLFTPVGEVEGRDSTFVPEGCGVGIIIRSRHFCMEVRGVNHTSDVITSAVRGAFLNDPAVRAEFLKLAGV